MLHENYRKHKSVYLTQDIRFTQLCTSSRGFQQQIQKRFSFAWIPRENNLKFRIKNIDGISHTSAHCRLFLTLHCRQPDRFRTTWHVRFPLFYRAVPEKYERLSNNTLNGASMSSSYLHCEAVQCLDMFSKFSSTWYH